MGSSNSQLDKEKYGIHLNLK